MQTAICGYEVERGADQELVFADVLAKATIFQSQAFQERANHTMTFLVEIGRVVDNILTIKEHTKWKRTK
jgi:hypothetical protein